MHIHAKKAVQLFKQGSKEQAEEHLQQIEIASKQVIHLINSLLSEIDE